MSYCDADNGVKYQGVGHMNPIKLLLTLITLTIFVVACSSTTDVESDMGIRGAPDWVNEGTKAVDNDDGRLLHGVGMAPAMNDGSLQKSTADNRARAEIARVLSTYIDSTISDYSASVGDQADMNIERDLRSTSQLALSGARILGRWKDKRTGDVYAFAELDLKKIDKLVSTATTLSDSFKRYYKESAGVGFERFSKSKKTVD
jgi:hypothetical protein